MEVKSWCATTVYFGCFLAAWILTFVAGSSDNTTVIPTTPCSISCQEITISRCSNILPYKHAGFPNFLGHTSSSKASEFDHLVSILILSNCYEYTSKFLCGVLFPQCDEENNGFILPPKTMCANFMKECENLLKGEDGSDSVLEVDCRKFPDPDSSDPVCYHSLSVNTSPSNKLPEPNKPSSEKNYMKIVILACTGMGLILVVVSFVSLCLYYTSPTRRRRKRTRSGTYLASYRINRETQTEDNLSTDRNDRGIAMNVDKGDQIRSYTGQRKSGLE